jgi:hypothetical protein
MQHLRRRFHSIREQERQCQTTLNLLAAMHDLFARRMPRTAPFNGECSANARVFQNARDLLDDVLNAVLDRIHGATRPAHPRRVTAVASHAKRNAIVRTGNVRAAASRPACGTRIARSRPPPAQPFRLHELRTWGRPRRGCGRRRLAPSLPARFRALACRDF